MKKNIADYDRSVPRYTSYPTAPQFSEKCGGETFYKSLSQLPKNNPISLYLHIPFCQELCHYCGCNTKITKQYKPIERYTKLLINEIKSVSDIIADKRNIAHIHFGGGTPNSLSNDDFSLIMGAISTCFNINHDAEIAVEIDPRHLTKSKAENYKSLNVNRISMGVQDFNPKVQQAINRIQPYDLVAETIDIVRLSGINKINLDLIYGLPFQTVDGVLDNIEKTISLKPDRISFFGYAHVPWMKKNMRLIDESALPTAQQRAEMFKQSYQLMTENNYVAIGLDHFVRPDDDMAIALKNGSLQRNFQGYTTDSQDILIGMGVSSISSLPSGYFQNVTNVKQYEQDIAQHGVATARGIEFQGEDKMRKEIIEELMCNMSVDLSAFISKYNLQKHHFAVELSDIAPIKDDGFIDIEDNIITIKDDNNQIVRIVCSYFDQYFAMSEAKHSKAV